MSEPNKKKKKSKPVSVKSPSSTPAGGVGKKKKKGAKDLGPDLSAMTPKQRKRYLKQQRKKDAANETAETAQAGNATSATAPKPKTPGGTEIGSNMARANKAVPDSSLGEWAFHDKSQYFLDDARLDPANDPTLQPMIDAFQREAEQDYQASVSDLQMQAEGGSRYGKDYYQAALGRSNEQFQEAQQGALANIYSQQRKSAEQARMGMLGIGNERDIAAGNIAAGLAQAQEAAAASRAASAASRAVGMAGIRLQREQWETEAPMRYLDAMGGFIGNMNQMGGYDMTPGFVPQPGPYTGPSTGSIIAGGIAAGAGTYLSYGKAPVQ